MMMQRLFSLVHFLLLALATVLLVLLMVPEKGLAHQLQFPEDQPAPEESFTQFFNRLTRGGLFSGIYLEAPPKFQKLFLASIRRGPWVGRRDLAQKQILEAGGDIWTDFYHSAKIAHWIAGDDLSHRNLDQAYNQTAMDSKACQGHCRSWSALANSDFSTWSTAEREALTLAYVTCFANSAGTTTLLDRLAEQYQMQAAEFSRRFEFRLLSNSDFEKAVRELGWQGPIYFRGITGPDPKNPKVQRILMNDELMRSMTPFEAPVLQFFEYVGILTHELSHVAQDLDSKKDGLELEIRSAEGALLIEGMAEYLAEQALLNFSNQTPRTQTRALGLYVAEAGVEILYRPGNSSTGNLFPYTVGLAFSQALVQEFGNSHERRQRWNQVILDQQKLGPTLTNLENEARDYDHDPVDDMGWIESFSKQLPKTSPAL